MEDENEILMVLIEDEYEDNNLAPITDNDEDVNTAIP
tara:strand:- start:35 stop:145 length:111 start_codon:yes stop_codon:yes gene_type:complete